MVLSAEEKIKIVQFWYETRSFVSLKRSFRREYGCNPSETPHNNVISRSVHHFEKEVVVHGKNQGRSGRSPVVTGGSDKVEEVRESVCEAPQTSTAPHTLRHGPPQPGAEDVKVYVSGPGTLEQLRLSVEE